MPQISVIVPVYNVEKWLDRCVASVVGQTYADFELLLVDDGSSDGCGNMCESWAKKDSRICVFHKPNGGLSDARNFGLEHARGAFITFIDSDDWVEPDYLSYLLSLFEEVPDAGFAEGSIFEDRDDVSHIRDDTEVVMRLGACEALESVMYDRRLYVSACGKLFKRTMMDGLKFRKGAVYEDSFLYKEYFERCSCMVYVGRPLYHYVVRADSITTRAFNYKDLKDHFVSYDELSAYAIDRFPELMPARKRFLAFSRMRTLRQMQDAPAEYDGLRDELRREVLSDAWELLKNPRVPKRDKIGILSLMPGMRFYWWAWNVYMRLRK